jgi:hypothetical protein
MIQGYRTIYDTGAFVSPPNPAASGAGKRAPADPTAPGPPVATLPAPQARRGPDAITMRPVTGTAGADTVTLRAPGSDTAEPAQEGGSIRKNYREPALPQLSAEALATALLSAEPDKALVPRVLPASLADDPL